MKLIKRELLGFLIAGCTANLTSFAFYSILYKSFNLSIFFASIIGQLLGVITNYIINSRLVFKKRLGLSRKILFITYYGIAIYLVGFLTESFTYMNIEYRVSWLISIIIATASNFLFVKFIAFKR